LFAALIKTALFDSSVSFGYCSWQWGAEYSTENWILLMNPYFLTMLIPAIPAMMLAIGTNRGQLFVDIVECIAWKVAGIIGLIALWIYLSVECYQFFDSLEKMRPTGHTIMLFGPSALTLFWVIAAAVLTALALHFRSATLRIVSMILLGIAVLKVFGDLTFRPEWEVPFLNFYTVPMLILAFFVIALAYFWASRLDDEDATERTVYRYFAFFGVFFLWLVMSVECFRSVELHRAGDGSSLMAQMALSILWSLFAGILIGIGFVWRSPVLRWMAIILFASTLMKILIVDMSGVNALYRFGAVFALATLLMMATWAYQRFKP
jgi:uncharacterized membrane protein